MNIYMPEVVFKQIFIVQKSTRLFLYDHIFAGGGGRFLSASCPHYLRTAQCLYWCQRSWWYGRWWWCWWCRWWWKGGTWCAEDIATEDLAVAKSSIAIFSGFVVIFITIMLVMKILVLISIVMAMLMIMIIILVWPWCMKIQLFALNSARIVLDGDMGGMIVVNLQGVFFHWSRPEKF